MKKKVWIMIFIVILGLLFLFALDFKVIGANTIYPTQAPTESCENDPGMPGCPTWTPPAPTNTPEPYPMSNEPPVDLSQFRPTYEFYLPVIVK